MAQQRTQVLLEDGDRQDNQLRINSAFFHPPQRRARMQTAPGSKAATAEELTQRAELFERFDHFHVHGLTS